MEQKTYGLAEVLTLTGVKSSQVSYWMRQGAVVPAIAAKGTGTHRGFNFANLAELAIANALNDVFGAPTSGVLLTQLRKADVWTILCDPRARRALPVLYVGLAPTRKGSVGSATPRDAAVFEVMPFKVPVWGKAVWVDAAITTPADVAARLEDGQPLAVVLNVDRIIGHLEQLTGETL
jgi:hypothetical protein